MEKENLNKIVFSDEKYETFRLTGFNGEMMFLDKINMFDKYKIDTLEFKFYKSEKHQSYINTLNYVFDNSKEIIQNIFDKILKIFDSWNTVDQNNNKISKEYLEKHLNIFHIEVSDNYGTIWGAVELNEGELSVIYSFDAHFNMNAKEIYVDIDFAGELENNENQRAKRKRIN